MMKKILLLAALAAVLVACTEKVKSESVTAPDITNVEFNADNVMPFQYVSVSAEASCKFGVYSVMLFYWAGNDPKTGKFVQGKVYGGNPEKVSYSGFLPGAKAGTKISFQVVSYSSHDVEGVSPIYTYEVKEGSGGGEVPID